MRGAGRVGGSPARNSRPVGGVEWAASDQEDAKKLVRGIARTLTGLHETVSPNNSGKTAAAKCFAISGEVSGRLLPIKRYHCLRRPARQESVSRR